MAQDMVGNFSGREGMELFPVHCDEHIKGFAQEVATTHARIEQRKACEIECCRSIQCVWSDVVFPGSWQGAIRVIS